MSTTEYPCIVCSKNITGRSHAIQCDVCERWQHRKCNTGITHIQYRQLQKNLISIDWSCENCRGERMDTDESSIDSTVSVTVTEVDPTTLHLRIPVPRAPESDTLIQLEPPRIPDTSFVVGNDQPLNRPPQIPDEELEDRPPGNEITDDGPITYELLENGTRLGARMLLSSSAFSYNVKRENKSTGFIYWVCSVRTKTNRCPAWVKQYETSYIHSAIQHNHPADPTKLHKLKVSAKVKTKAAENVFRPAGQIVKEVIRESNVSVKPDNLMRTANRHRQKMRPLDPKPDELDFEIDNEFIKADQFLVDDVRIDGARHLVFGTTEQLQHRARARRWFMDGTFKVVSRPFYQLASIHAFVKKDDDVKQVPLLFILMSRRQKRDYVAVFQAILRKLQPDEPNVEWIMLDFEIAAWQAIREVFRRILIRGCVFHWTQGVYKKVNNLGLSTAYSEGGDVFSFIRKILALPYLPAEHIIPAFEELSSLAAQGSSKAVNSLLEYVDSTWINGNVWKPENWSVFRETVRTNNDVEGWHRGLNSRANGSKLSFYVLVPLLLNEAND